MRQLKFLYIYIYIYIYATPRLVKYWNADDAGVAEFLAQACGRSGFIAGEAADIAGGCAGLGAYPVADCPSDYDVVRLDDTGSLHFGARPQDNNMCTPDKRPTALGVPLTRP